MSMILQTTSDVKGTANTRRRVKQRLVEWDEEKFDILGLSTIRCTQELKSRKKDGLKKKTKVLSSMICDQKSEWRFVTLA